MWFKSPDGFISPYLSAHSKSGQSPMHSSPIQDLFEIWVQDASLEITSAGFVRENNLIAGGKIIGYEMPGWEGFDVNYPEDLDYLNFLISSGLASL
jgi:CMP-N-acetylneuraminic acid synthetase